ncbi:MAG: hypothetical protein JWN60_2219 [Acidobacteria bacterium]|jgi:hypothetical protein|nr:hypothetical protein [Acidobacteriota bacterium]
MKLKITNWRFIAVLGLANFLFLVLLADDAAAQTARRSKTKRAGAVAQPTPVKTQGEPLIISRAEDFPNENQVVIQPVENQTASQTENSVEKTGTAANSGISDLNERLKSLEANQKKDPDEKQKRLLLNLDILTRAEQRSESLRKQLFEMIEKENQIKTRLDQIEYDIRPEMIERTVAIAGSLRPEELRDARRKTLTVDKSNLQTLLTGIGNAKTSLELNVQKADALVERLREKLEKQIDDALIDEPNQ